MSAIDVWKRRARGLKTELYALYLAYRDPRVPWHGRVLAACVVGYAFSPIDLIPDFIPVLGYLDDLVLVPLGVALVLRMIPNEVLLASRSRAADLVGEDKPTNWIAASVVIIVWLILAALFVVVVVKVLWD